MASCQQHHLVSISIASRTKSGPPPTAAPLQLLYTLHSWLLCQFPAGFGERDPTCDKESATPSELTCVI